MAPDFRGRASNPAFESLVGVLANSTGAVQSWWTPWHPVSRRLARPAGPATRGGRTRLHGNRNGRRGGSSRQPARQDLYSAARRPTDANMAWGFVLRPAEPAFAHAVTEPLQTTGLKDGQLTRTGGERRVSPSGWSRGGQPGSVCGIVGEPVGAMDAMPGSPSDRNPVRVER